MTAVAKSPREKASRPVAKCCRASASRVGSAGCADAILSWEPTGHVDFLDLVIRAGLARRAQAESLRRRGRLDIAAIHASLEGAADGE